MAAGRGRNKETNPIIEIQEYVANVLANHKLDGETDEQATRAAVADMLNIYGEEKIIEAGYGDYLKEETTEETTEEAKQEEKKVTQQARKITAGRYSYRGYTIYRDENKQACYFGSWRVWETSGTMINGNSLKECKNRIDRHIERINARVNIWEDYCNEVNEYRIVNKAARLQNLINKCAQKMVEWPNSREFYLKSLINVADMLNDTTKELADLMKAKADAKAGK